MALLLACVFMCELLPRLQSTRLNRGIAHDVQSPGYFQDADMTVVAYDEELLACEEVQTHQSSRVHHPAGSFSRFIIQGKDKLFMDYYYAVVNVEDKEDVGNESEISKYEEIPINCKTFTSPPKPSSVLKNLTTHTLPEDMISLIGSSSDDWHCNSCHLLTFNMTFFERCRTALASNQWARVQREVAEEGGSCRTMRWLHGMLREERPLQTCMTSAKADQIAVCSDNVDGRIHSSISSTSIELNKNEYIVQARQELIKKKEQQHQEFIKESEEYIKDVQDCLKKHEDIVQTRQDLIKKKEQEHQEFINESEELIKKKQENIKALHALMKDLLQELVRAATIHKHQGVYLKQMLEGP